MKLVALTNIINQKIKLQEDTAFVKFNLFTLNILQCLKKNKFIENFNLIGFEKKLRIKINFKMNNITKCNIIHQLKIISLKSNKIFLNRFNIRNKIDLNTEIILSTSSGIKTGREAIKDKIGGEYLFKIIYD